MADKVELSSIRISAELDASPYKRGAADIVAANKAISDTSKQTDSNVVSLQTKISQSGDVLARLSRQYVDGYASAQRFHSALQQLSNGMERGRITMAQATPILDGIYRKYGIMADASQFAARGQLELANAVEVANERLAQQQHLANDNALGVHTRRIEELRIQFDSTYAAARRLDDELRDLAEAERLGALTAKQLDDAMDGLIHKYDATAQAARRAREEHEAFIAGRANQRFSQSMGVQDRPPVGGPAVRSSAAVFEAEFARVEEIARQKAQQIGRNFNAVLNESFGMGIAPKQAAASMAVFEEAARDTELWAQKTALLKASLDPAAAAVERMNAEVAEYSEMLRRGTITAEQFAQAQLQSQQRHIGSQQGQGGQSRFGSMNAAAQFQDIAITAQMGQSPLTIALQQGTQLGQALESGMKAGAGLRGVITGLGTAFASMLSPVNLLAIGLTAVAAIGIQWFAKGKDAVDKMNEALKEQDRILKGMSSAYATLAKTAETNFQPESSNVTQRLLRINKDDARKAATEAMDAAIDTFKHGDWASMIPGQGGHGGTGLFLDIINALPTGVQSALGVDTTGPMSKFTAITDQMRAGTLSVIEGRKALQDLADVAPAMQPLVDSILKISNAAATAEQNLQRLLPSLGLTREQIDRAQSARQGERFSGGTVRSFEERRQLDESRDEDRLQAQFQQQNARTDAERIAAARRVAEVDNIVKGRERELAISKAIRTEQEAINREIRDEVKARADAREELIAGAQNELAAAGKTTVEAGRLRKEYELMAEALRKAKEHGGPNATVDPQEAANIRKVAAEYAALEAAVEAVNAAMERRISRQRAVSDAQHEVDIVGQTARQTAYLNSVYQQQQAIKEEAIRTGQSYEEMLKREGAAIEANARKVAELTALQQARAAIETRKDDLELRRAELGLIGQAGIAREAEIERIRTEIEIRKLGIDTMGAEATRLRQLTEELNRVAEATAKKNLQDDILFERRQIFRTPEDQEVAGRLRAAGLDENLNSAEAQMIRFNQQLERMKDTWQEIFDTVDDGIDSMVDVLFDGTASWEEELKKIGRQFARQMFDLALTNPLKNWLTGANTNTIADLGLFGSGASSGRGGGFGGVLGNLLGAQKAVSSMQVQAATVVVNGNLVNGIPGVTDVAAAAAGGGGGGGSVLRHVGGAGSVSSNFADVDSVVTSSVARVFKSAGSTSRGVPLSEIAAGNLTAKVSTEYAGRFQGLIDDLKAHGYPIKSLGEGGYSRWRMTQGGPGTGGSVSHHSYGEALDINPSQNPYRRGATGNFGEYGVDPNELARKHGLKWGGSWRTPDTMHFEVDKSIKASEEITVAATKAADSLTKVGLAGFESVKGLTDAAGGLTQFGSMLKSFMGPGGGSASGWFQNLAGIAGSAAGAVSGMQAISPGATQAIIAGGALGPKGLYHTGGIAGYPSSTRYVDDGVFMNARRYHGGGLAGDEVPAILRRGEPVFPSMAAARRMFANDKGYNPNRNEAPVINLKNINVFDPSVVGDYTRTDKGEQAMINMMRRTGSARGL